MIEVFLKDYCENQTLKQTLSLEVAARASASKILEALQRSKKSKLSMCGPEKDEEIKQLQNTISIHSAKIASLNQELVEHSVEDSGMSKVWAHVRSVADAKQVIKQAVATLEDAIKHEKEAHLSSLSNHINFLTLFFNGCQGRWGRQVIVPKIMMNGLKMPYSSTCVGIQSDDTVCK